MRYDPVAAALKRRQKAGVCLICGGEFVKAGKQKGKCENAGDMRHRQATPKYTIKPLTAKQKKVKLEEPSNAT